jgi:hypothetical protein
MVLQAYQNDLLIYEKKDVTSCTSITAADIAPGRTLLKIWVPGASVPSRDIWIYFHRP